MNSFTIIGLFSIFLSILIINSLLINSAFGQTHFDIVSTRGFFNLNSGNMIQENELPSVLSILNINNCPGEIVIYVHGVWATNEIAKEQTERVSLSLEKAGYDIPLIGFSWDSNTKFSLTDLSASEYGWNIAKSIANSNGPLLGKFIQQFNDDCPNDKLRILAHSLGSRVTLSAIQWLYENSIADISKKITSVHLLGAAIDDEQVSVVENQCNGNNPPLPCSGKAIYSEVENFYSLYNPEDNMLAPEEILYDPFPLYNNPYLPDEFTIVYPSPYQSTEHNDPLGLNEVKSKIGVPLNYEEYDVLSKIKNDNNADKKNGCDLLVNLRYYNYLIWYDNYECAIDEIGDNHFGYMGYRSSVNPQSVSDNGAIECVVLDWKNEYNYCQ